MRALAAVLCLFLQDGEVERWVRDLDDDDIAVRERAAERLISLGGRAREAVERAARADNPEVAARARRVLGEIELAAQRDRVLGPAWRLSLQEGEYALGDLASRFKEHVGVPLEVPASISDRKVRIGAKDSLAWDFLSKLCRADGGIRLLEGRPEAAFALEAGTPSSAPASMSGPFRVRLERLRIERRNLFDRTFEEGSMVLALDWQPNVKPVTGFSSNLRIHVEEILSQDGKALKVNPRDVERPYSGMSLGYRSPRAYRQHLTFEVPAPGTKRLALVRGRVDVPLPLKLVDVDFEKPLESAGQTRKAGDYTITLRHFERKAEGFEALVGFEAPVENEGEGKRSQQRLEIRARLGAFTLTDGAGKSAPGRTVRSSHRSASDAEGQRTEGHDAGLTFPADAPSGALRVSFLADYFERRVEFELRDVELP